MKTNFVLAMLCSFFLNSISAQTIQTCTTENFSGQAAGWTYSQGAHVGNYTNPAAGCIDDRGIITPGVGGNNPCNIQTPAFTSTGATTIDLTFDIIVLNANLKCNTWKDYACQTSVDVFYYIGQTRYTGVIDQLLPPNGPGNNTSVFVSFSAGNNLPAGTVYKIEMCFKPKSGVGNCIQQNTKYVFDNFRNCETANRPGNERHAITSTHNENIAAASSTPPSATSNITAQSVQTCTTENFSGSASGWTYSQGAHVGNYTNPAAGCIDDRGIITPGVGGNNPCNIQTPAFTSTGATTIDLTFDIIVLNANLKCNTWKDYACQTSVDVFYYIGQTRYTGVIDQLLPPNGPGNNTSVFVSFSAGNNLPAGTVYKIEMCFKPKSGVGNCIQQNTKYVFDNFRNCETANRPGNERPANTSIHHEIVAAPTSASSTNNVSAQTIQTCTTENFSGSASGWTYSQGAHVGGYTNPAAACIDDRGIITPGVGGNNPCNIQTPAFTSTGATTIDLTFDIIVLNANLKCNTWKDYACQTSVDVFYYIGQTRYTGVIDQLLPPNGPGNNTSVFVSFSAGNNLPAGTVYKIEMCFKPKSGVGNCIQQNTKYVFDNFRNCETANRPGNERSANTSPTQETTTAPAVCSVYPATTNGATRVTANGDAETKSISLIDPNGNIVRSVSGTAFIVFDVQGMSPGKYMVQFEKKNGDQLRKPVIITKTN